MSEAMQSSDAGSSGFEIGADLDSSTYNPSPDTGSSAQPQTVQPVATSQPEFDPLTANWTRLRDEDVPETYRPLARIGRSMNQRHSQAMQEVARAKEAAAAEVQRLRTIADASQVMISQRQSGQPVDAEQQTNLLLARHGYTPQTPGYEEARIVHGITNEVVQSALAPYTQALQQIAQTVQNVQQSLFGFQYAQTAQTETVVRNELAEASELYGEDEIVQYGQAIAALRGKTNPVTKEPHTVRSAYELVSGRAQQNASVLREQSKRVVGQSRAAAAPAPSVGSPGAVPAQMSDAQLATEVERILSGGRK